MHTRLEIWDISRVRIQKEAAKKDVGGKVVAMHSLTMERDLSPVWYGSAMIAIDMAPLW